jgi:hypothetical protein
MKLFNSLRGTVNIGEMPNVTLPAEVLDHWKEIAAAWKEATHWVEWSPGGQDFLTYAC